MAGTHPETHAEATDRADAAELRADASDDRADNLQIALDTRDVIGMAKGILMHTEDIGPDDAFEILVQVSQREQRKLHDVAADLVARYPSGSAPQP